MSKQDLTTTKSEKLYTYEHLYILKLQFLYSFNVSSDFTVYCAFLRHFTTSYCDDTVYGAACSSFRLICLKNTPKTTEECWLHVNRRFITARGQKVDPKPYLNSLYDSVHSFRLDFMGTHFTSSVFPPKILLIHFSWPSYQSSGRELACSSK